MEMLRGVAISAGLAFVCAGAAALRAAPAVAVAPAQSSPFVESCPDAVDPTVPTTAAEADALIVGTWIRCGDGALLPPAGGGNEVGIEFAADGTFHRLYEEDGALLRVEGLEQQGRWITLFEPPDTFQLNTTILGSGTVYTNPTFYGTPRSLMRTPHMSDESAGFVPWTGDPPVPGVPDALREASCGLPTDPIEPESVDQVEELLVGTWVRCSPDSAIGNILPGEVGLDITSDGRFFRLYDDGRGGLIRASGGSQEGTWELIDGTGAEWPGGYQLDLTVVGTSIGHAVFLAQPSHFRFVAFPAADYQAWTGTPPVAGDPPVVTLPVTGTTESSQAAVMLALVFLALGGTLAVLGRRLGYGFA